MKTLDEVIDYCEGKQTCGEWVGIADALHYLREYRDSKATIADAMERYTRAALWHMDEANKLAAQSFVLEYDNPPLTWDELKAMEGKPVWVEQRYQKMWGLNDGTYLDAFGDDCITIKVLHDLCHFEKKLIGITWQAYRKER